MMAKRNPWGVIALVAAAAALAFPAAAQQGGPDRAEQQPPRSFRMLDTNGDGKVTVAEITAEQERLLGAADLDGDGKLSVDEFRRRGWWFQQLQTTTLFDLMDTNGDRTLTAEEIASPTARWFKRYDANADGGMTVDEVPHWQRHGRGKRGR